MERILSETHQFVVLMSHLTWATLSHNGPWFTKRGYSLPAKAVVGFKQDEVEAQTGKSFLFVCFRASLVHSVGAALPLGLSFKFFHPF